MHISKQVYTAQDLYELLQEIPIGIRERLPLEIISNDGMTLIEGPFDAEAFEETETEGCIERAFRIGYGDED